MRPRPTDHARGDAGFSLVEVLVALAIVSLAAGILGLGLRRPAPIDSQRRDVPAIVNLMMSARMSAVLQSREEVVHVDIGKRSIEFRGTGTAVSLADSVSLNVLVGAELVEGTGQVSILFFPDGSSTGAEIRFAIDGTETEVLRIPWATGIPAVETR